MDNKTIYRLNDEISFRKCDLYECGAYSHGDCTNFKIKEVEYDDYYSCKQEGIHFHCTKHPEIEFEYIYNEDDSEHYLYCPKCNNKIKANLMKLIQQSLKTLNREIFKNAEYIRLDDWYTPEIKMKGDKRLSDYWLKSDVKTDKDGDTIVVLYVGNNDDKTKAQFFIKPEKCQLSNDHKDTDPSKVIAKIEVTLKKCKLTHYYDE